MSTLHEQLFQACYSGKSIEDVFLLIKQGANIQWRNPHYVSCCCSCCYCYEVIIVATMMINIIIVPVKIIISMSIIMSIIIIVNIIAIIIDDC